MNEAAVAAQRPSSGVPTRLTALADQLWSLPDRSGAVRVTTTGSLPAGFRLAEEYLAVPTLRAVRYLVPTDSRRAAGASTSTYNGLRLAGPSLARTVIGTALRFGPPQRLMPATRVRVAVDPGISESHLAEVLLREHLRQVLGLSSLVLGIGVRELSPYRKPTVQLFSVDGRPEGCAKIGWNDSTRQRVRNEAAAVARLQTRGLRSLRLPRLLHAGSWEGREVSVVAPLPVGVRMPRDFDTLPDLEALRELAGGSASLSTPLGESSYWRRLGRRLDLARGAGDEHEFVATMASFAAAVSRSSAEVPLHFGPWHGDWVPWNVARHGQELWAWDWELAEDDVPVGFDAVHWDVQVGFVHRGRSLAESLRSAVRRSPRWASSLGVDPASVTTIAALYLLEISARAYEMCHAGAGWNARFRREAAAVMRETPWR